MLQAGEPRCTVPIQRQRREDADSQRWIAVDIEKDPATQGRNQTLQQEMEQGKKETTGSQICLLLPHPLLLACLSTSSRSLAPPPLLLPRTTKGET